MLTRLAVAAALAVAPAIFAAPAPQNSFGPDSQVSAQPQTTSGPDYPVVVEENGYLSATFHGPYTGTPTTTGAANGPTTTAASIPALPPNPTATYYNTAGVPINPMPAPYTPAGGLGTNGTQPRYMLNSDFDFESIALGLYQEVSGETSKSTQILLMSSSGSSSICSTMVSLAFRRRNLQLPVSMPSTCP